MIGADQHVEAHQGAGGPRLATSNRQRFDQGDLEARIGALDTLAIADLRIAWRKLYCTEPPSRLSRDLLMRGVAYKLQEHAHGGLSSATMRRLHSLVGVRGNGDWRSCPLPP